MSDLVFQIYTGCYDGSVRAVKLNLLQNFRCWVRWGLGSRAWAEGGCFTCDITRPFVDSGTAARWFSGRWNICSITWSATTPASRRLSSVAGKAVRSSCVHAPAPNRYLKMLLQLTVWSMWRPVQVWDVCVCCRGSWCICRNMPRRRLILSFKGLWWKRGFSLNPNTFNPHPPYWGGDFVKTCLGGVRRLHPLCAVLESNHNTIEKGGMVVLLRFFYVPKDKTRLPLSPNDQCGSSCHWPKYISYWRNFSAARVRVRGTRHAFLFKLQQQKATVISFWMGWLWYGMG